MSSRRWHSWRYSLKMCCWMATRKGWIVSSDTFMRAYWLPLSRENNAQASPVNTNPEVGRTIESVIVQELKQALALQKCMFLPTSLHLSAGFRAKMPSCTLTMHSWCQICHPSFFLVWFWSQQNNFQYLCFITYCTPTVVLTTSHVSFLAITWCSLKYLVILTRAA